jgi:hypothetical protein
MAGSTQIRNSEQVNLLRADFQPRYEPNFAWKSAVSSLLALPGLRACWPMSSVDYAAATQCRDVSGGGYHLTNNAGIVTFGYNNLAPVAVFGGAANQYLSRADGGAGNWADILGTETYITAGQQGLSFGGWFLATNAATASNQGLISKYDTGAAVQRSYVLYISGVGVPTGVISNNGVATVTISSTITLSNLTWYFLWCIFVPSTSLTIYVNGTASTNVAGIPANVFDSTSAVAIGGYYTAGAIGNYFGGMASMCGLCAAALSDAQIGALYQQQRAMFGV